MERRADKASLCIGGLQDRNAGLVRRCLALHRQRRIQRLGEVYSALSLAKIAQLVGIEAPDAVPAVHADVQEIVSSSPLPLRSNPPLTIGRCDESDLAPILLVSTGSKRLGSRHLDTAFLCCSFLR